LHIFSTAGTSGTAAYRLKVEGANGQLFLVNDNLTGSLMAVSDISGLPILEVFSTDVVVMGTYGSNAVYVNGDKTGFGTTSPATRVEIASGTSGVSGLRFTNFNSLSATTAGGVLGVDTTGNVVRLTSAAGSSGSSGASGSSGSSGASGSSGSSGASGSSGSSGASGSSGSSGASGSSGSSGSRGTSGSSGSSGASGSSGSSGSRGTSGSSGSSGASGSSGSSGASGSLSGGTANEITKWTGASTVSVTAIGFREDTVNGRLGVGTASPGQRFHIAVSNSAATYCRVSNTSGNADYGIDGSGNAIFGATTGGKYLSFLSNNVEGARLTTAYDLLVKNDIVGFSTTLSDQRLKTNIKRLDNTEILDKVLEIQPSTYEWNDKIERSGTEYGVIAQEIEKLFPEIVTEKEEVLGVEGSVKLVDYTRLGVLAISAIQELYRQIQELKKQK
jgi:hypothetical protein